MHNMSTCCTFSPARWGALLLLRHVFRVLEGGINMQDRSNLRYRLRSPMRRADTCGLHLVAPYVGCVPGGIRVSLVENPPRRWAPGPYEGPVGRSYLQVREYLTVAAYRYSLGYTCGVPL